MEDYARIFIDEIVCRHGILLSIISDRVYNSHLGLEIIPKRVGYYDEVEHHFSSPNGWSSGMHYSNP